MESNDELNTRLINESLIIKNNTPNDLFLKRVYNYYYMKGYIPITIDKITYLLINYFLIFFVNFLTNCIDYKGLMYFKKNEKIINYIHIENIFPTNYYLIICLFVFIIYCICLTINTINEIKIVFKMRNIFKDKLNISNNELEYISWFEVVNRIKRAYSDPNLNEYTIASKILRKENIIINLYKNKFKYLPKIGKLIEWNFIFSIIDPLFNNYFEITNETIQRDTYIKKVKKRCKLVLLINLVSMPFVLYIVIIYLLINYAEQFYNNPESSFTTFWNIKGYWKLRYYNELNHSYDLRSNKIKISYDKINKFHSNINLKSKEIVLRFINFVLGSIFVLLLILSILNENILMHGILFNNKTILWFMGILGGILAVNRNFINSSFKKNIYHQEENLLFEDLKKNLPIINPNYFEFENRKKCIKLLNNLQYTNIYFIFSEIINICLSPLYIYKWLKNINIICEHILNNLEDHIILGFVNKKCIFTNINYLENEPHSYYSFIDFINHNPKWNHNIPNFESIRNNISLYLFNWDDDIWNENNIININDSFINIESNNNNHI